MSQMRQGVLKASRGGRGVCRLRRGWMRNRGEGALERPKKTKQSLASWGGRGILVPLWAT